MNRWFVVVTLATTCACSTIAFASLYSWNDTKRPPISLADALARAEKLLGEDAVNRYCVGVGLYGDETFDGKIGKWNLYFAAADGSKKHVYIDMLGNGEVRLLHGPIDWKEKKGRRDGIADVRRRLEELFAKEHIEAQYVTQGDALIVKYHSRVFKVYPEREDGGFGNQLEDTEGPDSDGIWLSVRVVDKPIPWRSRFGYWRGEELTHILTQRGKFLKTETRIGPLVPYEIDLQITRVFGERTPY